MVSVLFSIAALLSLSRLSLALPIIGQTHNLNERATTHTAVVGTNFPDPTFIEVNQSWYAFATSDKGFNIQIAQSASFSNPVWQTLTQDALPDAGSWTDGSHNIWAPYITQLIKGRFVLYYAAPPSSDSTKHCVGAATADTILGPYTPQAQPLACPLVQGGAIDPAAFKDPASGNQYIVYKVDGNSLNNDGTYHPTPIMLQQVNPSDGTTPIGGATQILDRDSWDGPLVEAPAMFTKNGIYYLFFSSNA